MYYYLSHISCKHREVRRFNALERLIVLVYQGLEAARVLKKSTRQISTSARFDLRILVART